MTTWGEADDLRHFLPRIFELISSDGGSWTVPEVIFGKLDHAQWTTWPSDERAAIKAFFQALWSSVLDRYPHVFEAAECLRSCAMADDDMTPYLAGWHIARSLTHAKHFAELIEYHPVSSDGHGWSLKDVYWCKRPSLERQVVDWLRDPARSSELEDALVTLAREKEDRALLSEAIDNLARLRSDGSPFFVR